MKPRLLSQKAILACLLALMLLAPVAEAQGQVVRRDFATLTTAQINALRNAVLELVHPARPAVAFPLAGQHDTVHNTVGGWMGSVNLAARDPIFWLHHANIDRLWKRWLDLGGGRSNPPASDTVWMNTPFTFFDENGQSVTRTGAQILNTVTQLNYRYDDDPAAAELPARERLAAREMLGTSIETEVDLLPTHNVRFSVPIKEEVRPKITRAVEAGTLILNIEGIEYDEDPGVYYEVYINLPKGEKAPDPRSQHFVGTLATFALPQGGKHMLAITEAARDLKGIGRWNDKNISVTFVPRGPLPPPGKAVAPIPEAALRQPPVTVVLLKRQHAEARRPSSVGCDMSQPTKRGAEQRRQIGWSERTRRI